MTDTTYNGWANYETWNVVLWIGNDEFWYGVAKECQNYQEFMNEMIHTCGVEATPDEVDLDDPNLDIDRLNEMFNDDF